MPKWNYEIRPAAGERLNSRVSRAVGSMGRIPGGSGNGAETAMTRCRDMIIERSKWVCSIAAMSAIGIGMFGVAGASGRGSAWSAVHPAKAHVLVVHSHGSAQISSHVSHVSHAYNSSVSRHVVSSGYSSHTTVVHATATRASYASSAHPVQAAASAPAATTHASAPAAPVHTMLPCFSRVALQPLRRLARAHGPPLAGSRPQQRSRRGRQLRRRQRCRQRPARGLDRRERVGAEC